MFYKTKPARVTAWQFSDDEDEYPEFISKAMSGDKLIPHPMFPETRLQVVTSTGPKIVDKGDWVIEDNDGNLDVMKPDDFHDTYVEDPLSEAAMGG